LPTQPPQFFLHLTPDAVFIEHGFPLYESVAPGVNRVVCVTDDRPPIYLKATPLHGTTTKEFTDQAQSRDCIGVVLHSLPDEWLPLLSELPADVAVLWRGWGYEYYGSDVGLSPFRLLEPLFPRGLLMPFTRRVVNNHFLNTRRTHSPLGGLKNALRVAATRLGVEAYAIHRINALARICATSSAMRRRAIQRIDWFAPVIPTEYAAVTRLYPWFSPRQARFPYARLGPQPTQPCNPTERSAGDGRVVIVGNSATATGNHFDAFYLLTRHECFKTFRIIAPLSYGSEWYRDAVVEAGVVMFGDHFVPLTTFLPQSQYFALLGSCTHALMPHIRQQAAGNVYGLLRQGAKVAMNHESLLYQHLRSLGIAIWTLDDVRREPQAFAACLDDEARQRNQKILCRGEDPRTLVRKVFDDMAALTMRRRHACRP